MPGGRPGLRSWSPSTRSATSETSTPWTSSAGCVAQKLANPEDWSAAPRISHSAGAVRKPDGIGMTFPSALVTTKSATPCSSGVRPVTAVVQSSGETIGS